MLRTKTVGNREIWGNVGAVDESGDGDAEAAADDGTAGASRCPNGLGIPERLQAELHITALARAAREIEQHAQYEEAEPQEKRNEPGLKEEEQQQREGE